METRGWESGEQEGETTDEMSGGGVEEEQIVECGERAAESSRGLGGVAGMCLVGAALAAVGWLRVCWGALRGA